MPKINLRETIRTGLLFGLVALSVSAIGMVETFDDRDIISGIFTLGQLLLYSLPVLAGYFSVRGQDENKTGATLISGFISGFISALPLVGLILLTLVWPDIRQSLPNVSPQLIEILTFGQTEAVGSLMLLIVMSILGLIGAGYRLVPEKIGRPLFNGLIWVLVIGLFSEIIRTILLNLLGRTAVRVLFGSEGVQPIVAVIIFIVAAVFTVWWRSRGQERYQRRRSSFSEKQNKQLRQIAIALGVLLILVLPLPLGPYLTEVLDQVGLFILMGLGLNIVVGFAGLLDLGYVAFFAIGAYVMGLLTTTSELNVLGTSFWIALPFSILAAVIFGLLLGVPVLRMRGDYLAIVTLGFGEIIRVLVTSDLLKGIIGGAQGILQIGRPKILTFVFVQPREFYYLILIGCLLAVFVSSRLRDSRLGRRWMALREDEDVAEAMGIHLVSTKLLAFAIGAAFAGLSGALFASRISSIFPHSFQLLISINVLSLIIVGGIGSLPGVVVGALFLIGLPELLREFAEYRLLMYGGLLVAMMLYRPEGLWPSPIRKRELHADDEDAAREGPTALDDVASLT